MLNKLFQKEVRNDPNKFFDVTFETIRECRHEYQKEGEYVLHVHSLSLRAESKTHSIKASRCGMAKHEPEEHIALRLIRIAQTATPLPNPVPFSRPGSPLSQFGMMLGSLRKKRQFTLDGLAEKANLTPDDVLAIEVGLAPLDRVRESLAPLAGALDADYHVLSKKLVELIFAG